MAGYTFKDDLSDVGDYVAGSFKVGTIPIPDATVLSENKLNYPFLEGSTSPQTITFKTRISDDQYYANSEQTTTNTGQLVKDENVVEDGEGSVKFTPKWIEKAGKSSEETGSGVY
ncbi:MAG: hypothetical protein GX850_02900, partial [Clostridiaceae bacterium]|nr:hypothetical protein [Clostridiaceae bacterium]